MSTARGLLAIARADFLERARRPGFLVTIGATLWATYIFLPPNHATYATLQFGGHRGVYNSAWVGSLVAILATVFVSFAGFYLVKNSVERDRRSGVGQILAATPVSKLVYTLGKGLSNFAVLASIVALLMVGAAVMQRVRGEDLRLDALELTAPFALITLPAMAVVAAVAVLFEVVPALRGGLGNVAYFFLWSFGLVQGGLRHSQSAFDLLGMGLFVPSMTAACRRAYPDFDLERAPMSLGLTFKDSGTWDLTTFRWEGLDWSLPTVLARLAWFGVALGFCVVAASWFDRFDVAPAPARRRRAPAPRADETLGARVPAAGAAAHLTPLSAALDFGLAPLVAAELKLMLRGLPKGWWLVTAGLVLASLFAPLTAVRRGLLPALWIWPLLVWSPLGNREARHGTGPLLFSAPRPVLRPLLAQWLAGALLALALGAIASVRLAIARDFPGLVGGWVAASFVPALALALGAWSGSSKLFEVLYLLLWYVGPLNHAPGLDYVAPRTTLGAWPWVLVTAACFGGALLARARR